MKSEKFKNIIIVAPMVRVGTLPFRLLCLEYGANLVYTQETIDFKMLRSIKRHNEALNTIDFVDKSDGTIFFRTCEKEKPSVIFQIGTCDAQRALKVAKMVEPYVSGIDVNMGCPKEFSIKGGMGAALLTQPEKVKNILTTLVNNLSITVSCKIRLLPSFEETLELCHIIEGCGVAALAIHGRRKEERPNHANHNDIIAKLAKNIAIPVIANGGSKEISNLEDVQSFRDETHSSSVMLARAVMWNCSILRKKGKLPLDEVIESYLKLCVQYDNPFTFTKYTVQNMLRELQCTERGQAFLEVQTLQELCCLWGLKSFYNTTIQDQNRRCNGITNGIRTSTLPTSVTELSITWTEMQSMPTATLPVQFIRGNYSMAALPKMLLNTHVYRERLEKPVFSTEIVDKFFIGSVRVAGVIYKSSLREKSSRYAEQAAALVCLHIRKVVGEEYGFVPMEGARKHTYEIENGKHEEIKEKHGYEGNAVKKKRLGIDCTLTDGENVQPGRKPSEECDGKEKKSLINTEVYAEHSNELRNDENT